MRADAELGGLHRVRSAPSLGYTAPQSCSDSWKLSVCGGMQGGLMEQLVGAVVWGGVSLHVPRSPGISVNSPLLVPPELPFSCVSSLVPAHTMELWPGSPMGLSHRQW